MLRRDRRCWMWGLVLLTAMQAGCGLVTRTQRMFGGALLLDVVVSPQANRQSPVAVDLLVVYDKAVLEKLLALPGARAWFEQAEQWQRDFPGAFERRHWEWVPGQPVPRQEVELRLGARAAILFADYLTPGAHRVRVDPRKPARLLLGEESLSVEPLKE